MSELAGHKVDTTFEQYKNAWLLWSGSMKKPVKVDTYCSSLDILPTLSNMLGLEYDSRMLAGTDVFGNKEPFVVFADRSWISQNGNTMRQQANTPLSRAQRARMILTNSITDATTSLPFQE